MSFPKFCTEERTAVSESSWADGLLKFRSHRVRGRAGAQLLSVLLRDAFLSFRTTARDPGTELWGTNWKALFQFGVSRCPLALHKLRDLIRSTALWKGPFSARTTRFFPQDLLGGLMTCAMARAHKILWACRRPKKNLRALNSSSKRGFAYAKIVQYEILWGSLHKMPRKDLCPTGVFLSSRTCTTLFSVRTLCFLWFYQWKQLWCAMTVVFCLKISFLELFPLPRTCKRSPGGLWASTQVVQVCKRFWHEQDPLARAPHLNKQPKTQELQTASSLKTTPLALYHILGEGWRKIPCKDLREKTLHPIRNFNIEQLSIDNGAQPFFHMFRHQEIPVHAMLVQ